MSLGREAIRKTLRNLKRNCIMDVDYWIKICEANIEFMSKISEGKSEMDRIIFGILENTQTASIRMHRSLTTYMDALEAFVLELDQTFDKLLQEAEKEAEKEAERQPRIPDIYR